MNKPFSPNSCLPALLLLFIAVLFLAGCGVQTLPVPETTPPVTNPAPLTASPTPSASPTANPSPTAPVPTSAPAPTPLPEHLETLPVGVLSFAIDPFDPQAAYALLETNQLYRTRNRGQTWQRLPLPLEDPSHPIERIEILSQPDLVVSPVQNGRLWVRAAGTLFTSPDHGQTWQNLLDEVSLWAMDNEGRRIYAWRPDLQAQEAGFYRSRNGGSTWNKVSPNLIPLASGGEAANDSQEQVFSLVLDHTILDHLYAGTASGIYRSFDGGVSWKPFQTGLPLEQGSRLQASLLAASPLFRQVYALLEILQPQGERQVFLARLEHGTIIPDQDHWALVGQESLSAYLDAHGPGLDGLSGLFFDLLQPERLYLGSSSGLLVSRDAGASWEPLAGLPSSPVHTAAVSPAFVSQVYLSGPAGFWTGSLNGVVLDGHPSADLPLYEEALEIIGQYGGALTSYAVREDLGYLAIGPHLVVADLSNPVSVRRIGLSEILPGMARQVVLLEDYAYLPAGDKGLLLVNIANPRDPYLAAAFPTTWEAEAVYMRGEVAYLSERGCYLGACSGRVRLFDVSDPSWPVEMGVYELPAPLVELVFSGKNAYLLHQKGLQVLDLSNPTSFRLLASLDLNSAGSLLLEGDYAFIGGAELSVIDLSDPEHLFRVAVYQAIPGRYDRLVLVENYLWMQGQFCEFGTCFDLSIVLDVSDPADPQEVQPENAPDFPEPAPERFDQVALNALRGPIRRIEDIVLVNGRVYIPWQTHTVMDVTYPGSPQFIYTPIDVHWAPGRYAGVSARNYAYMPAWNEGLHILRIGDPIHPTPLSTLSVEELGGFAYEAVLSGSNLLVVLGYDGLRLVDVSDPRQPKLSGKLEIRASSGSALDSAALVENLVVRDGFAYLVSHFYLGRQEMWALVTVDISNPAVPRQIGQLQFPTGSPGRPRMLLQDGKLFVTRSSCTSPNTCSGSLAIFDLANPAEPAFLGQIDLLGEPRGIAVRLGYVYVAAGLSGVWVVGIPNDEEQPYLAGHLETPGSAHELVMLGNRLYIADGAGGLLLAQPFR